MRFTDNDNGNDNAFTACYQSYPSSISSRSFLLKQIQEVSIACKYLAHFLIILESQYILGRGNYTIVACAVEL